MKNLPTITNKMVADVLKSISSGMGGRILSEYGYMEKGYEHSTIFFDRLRNQKKLNQFYREILEIRNEELTKTNR